MKSTGDLDTLIKNSINDYTRFNFSKKKEAYDVTIEETNDTIYQIIISKIDVNKISPWENDTIGNFSKFFPSKYVIKSNKLFIWADYTKALSIDLIKQMSNYKVIDSTYLKTGESPLFLINEKKKAMHYCFCKNDFTNFIKKKTNYRLRGNDLFNLRCNKK